MDVLGSGFGAAVTAVVLAAALLALLWALRPPPRRSLRGKVVLLTGAGGGLGRHLAQLLSRRGCLLACVDVAAKPNEETVALLQQEQQQQQGDRPLARAYTADLSKREAIYSLVDKVIEDFGHVDILLSNAGQLQGGALWECTDDQLDMVLDVNLRATLRLTKALVPHMRARGEGHIVAISSVTARVPGPNITAYSCSKAGLSQAMECLHHDLRHAGLHNVIHVTTVQPFFIRTFSRLSNAVRFSGRVQFLEVDDVARQVVTAIEQRRHVVDIPSQLSVLAPLLGSLPRGVLAFVQDKLMGTELRPAFSYEHRHRPLDASILHELLSKGYPLEEDPADVCAGLCDDQQGRAAAPPSFDFAPYARQVADFYRERGQSVPAAVKRVFSIAT